MANSSEKIIDLLKQVTNMQVVKDFLQSKDLAYSANSWSSLYDKRIEPSLKNGQINEAQLIELLSDAEESGRQHIFLFSVAEATAKEYIDQKRIDAVIASLDLGDIPLILEKPEIPTITDIRIDKGQLGSRALVVKVVSTRIGKVKSYDKTTDVEQVIKYTFVKERAVNVLKIHETGLIEIRIQSESGISGSYDNEVDKLLGITNVLGELPKKQLSLSKAKTNMWKNRKTLKEKISYTSSTLRDEYGISLKAATNKKEISLTENIAAAESLNAFLNNDGYCEHSNVWFLRKSKDNIKPIHVLLEGDINEFVLPTHSARADYDYVLSEILTLNR